MSAAAALKERPQTRAERTREQRANGDRPVERRCIVSGKPLPVESLLRFVVGPDDRIVPDVAGTLGGRGIWVEATRPGIETAVRRSLFQRAARRKVGVPDGLAETVEGQLVDRVVQSLSLARKAGQAVAGYAKVSAQVRQGHCALLLLAHDGAANALGRLDAEARSVERLDCLAAAELGGAFGREHAVYAGVSAGGLATRLQSDGRRLAGFRGKTMGEVGHDAEH